MKQLFFFLAAAVTGFSACQSFLKRDDTRAFMPGVYVRAIDHEFATGGDTLVVRQLRGNTYEIVKRSGVIPVRDGKPLPFRRNVETWTAIYEGKDQALHEQKRGKIISFVPKENKLLVGSSAYQKIK